MLYAYRLEGAEGATRPVACMGGDSADKQFKSPEGFAERLKSYGLKPPADDYASVAPCPIEFCSNSFISEEVCRKAELLPIGKFTDERIYSVCQSAEDMA